MMADESAARTVVTFASPRFNTTDPKPYFINECCFGDDLANWMIEELRNRGVEVDGMLGQEDFGWYFNFTIGGLSHCFIVGYRPDDDTWIGWWRGGEAQYLRFWGIAAAVSVRRRRISCMRFSRATGASTMCVGIRGATSMLESGISERLAPPVKAFIDVPGEPS